MERRGLQPRGDTRVNAPVGEGPDEGRSEASCPLILGALTVLYQSQEATDTIQNCSFAGVLFETTAP
jgi:hypothetical protein